MYNIFIPFFEWDEDKNTANQRKHGVSFAEAKTVFFNENAKEASDPDHSAEEDRHILVGLSARSRVLMVSFCYRRDLTMIRIISARKLNKTEEERYWRLLQ